MKTHKGFCVATAFLLLAVILAGCGSTSGGGFGFIAFDTGSVTKSIFIMKGDGSGERLVVTDGAQPSLRGDGNVIAFVRGQDIYTISTNGTGLARVTSNAAGILVSEPAFTQLGDKIAYVERAGVSATPSIRLINANGTGDRELVADADYPAFSSDGQTILFVRGTDLYTLGIDGTGLDQLTDHGVGTIISDPTFRPLDDDIAFASQSTTPGAQPSVVVLQPDGSESVLIANASQPTYAPTGFWVAFLREGRIYSTSLVITDFRDLTAGPNDSHPCWGD